MNYAIILAGGLGSRFWPLSCQSKPKQFLKLCSGKSLLEDTLNRLSGVVDRKNIYIATSRLYRKNIRQCLHKSKISPKNIFFEPSGKSTLAPVAVLSKFILNKDKDALVLVLPSDHYINDAAGFKKALIKATFVAKKSFIVTLGIKPDFPNTGYGYLKLKSGSKDWKKKGYYEVKRFIEKPQIKKAKRFIRSGKYFWNAGIFVFKAAVFLDEIRKHSLNNYEVLELINDKKGLNKHWKKFKSTSIDYAVMEESRKIALLPVDFNWCDLGNWLSLEATSHKDREGNIIKGSRIISVAGKNNIIWSDHFPVAVLGIKELIVAATENGILVCTKRMAQEVKGISAKFKEA